MSLGNKQRQFTRAISKLITWAYDNGYELTVGDAYRDPRLFGAVGVKEGYGHSKSAHKKRLAMDLNLFKDGKYMTKTSDHKPLGDYWVTLHEDATWGGTFKDGNHYSFKDGGCA
tara:strand:- start:520 stop:861 length:342 start_codon:yes stop_codon:yes gene_type:complete